MSIELTERSTFRGKARDRDLKVDTGSIGAGRGKNGTLNAVLGAGDQGCKVGNASGVVGNKLRVAEFASNRGGV